MVEYPLLFKRWSLKNDKDIEKLGWERYYYAGSLLLYKKSDNTKLSSSIIVYTNDIFPESCRFLQNLRHRINCFMEWYIFSPDGVIEVFGGFVPRNKISRKMSRTLFGHLEAYLSCATNI